MMCLEDLRLGLARYTGQVQSSFSGGNITLLLTPNARRQALVIALDTTGASSPNCVTIFFGSPSGFDGVAVLGVNNPTITFDVETHGKMIQSSVYCFDSVGVFTTYMTEIVSNVNPPEYGG